MILCPEGKGAKRVTVLLGPRPLTRLLAQPERRQKNKGLAQLLSEQCSRFWRLAVGPAESSAADPKAQLLMSGMRQAWRCDAELSERPPRFSGPTPQSFVGKPSNLAPPYPHITVVFQKVTPLLIIPFSGFPPT